MLEIVPDAVRSKTARTMARQAMLSRRQFVQTAPERTRALQFHFPIWRGGAYAGWQVELAMRVLESLAPRDVPLDRRRLTPAQAAQTPLVRDLRDFDRLESVAAFTEYQFDWPERITMDAALDAERLGATIRNYAPVLGMARDGDKWRLTIGDALEPGARAQVVPGHSRVVALNPGNQEHDFRLQRIGVLELIDEEASVRAA